MRPLVVLGCLVLAACGSADAMSGFIAGAGAGAGGGAGASVMIAAGMSSGGGSGAVSIVIGGSTSSAGAGGQSSAGGQGGVSGSAAGAPSGGGTGGVSVSGSAGMAGGGASGTAGAAGAANGGSGGQACIPRQVCANAGVIVDNCIPCDQTHCGTYSDGCTGTVDCGMCPGANNYCTTDHVCKPISTDCSPVYGQDGTICVMFPFDGRTQTVYCPVNPSGCSFPPGGNCWKCSTIP